MQHHLPTLCASLAVATALIACQDSSTAPTQGKVASSTPSFATTPGQSSQFHFIANGANGTVNWTTFDPSGGRTDGELFVGRGGSTRDPQTLLVYRMAQCDALSNCTFFHGEGTIPNEDLSQGLSAKQLHLSTNTSGNPNFTTFEGPTGLVSVDWKADGISTQTISGTTKTTFLGLTTLSQGSLDNVSANATGSVVGVPISPDILFANIGTMHGVSIEITH